ncbi:ATP-binding protein [Leifsonia sp. NPDC058292]|uniref:ATP-binding protein n=1 Tax=Leifsonia sp. NPDC058292 TaxID=3346428 RepID=UPI0036DE8BCA
MPLFSENRSDGVWGTFAISDHAATKSGRVGTLVVPHGESGPNRTTLVRELAGGMAREIVGIVRESSTLTHLRVEILPDQRIASGQVLVIPFAGELVYFQVTGIETSEEPFGGLHYGSQIATAVQIGVLRDDHFRRFDYLPPMNALAYLAESPSIEQKTQGLFPLGGVPGTGVTLYGSFLDQLESHTALLGATGTGKTEFAFDLIRYAVKNGVKVICIDLTSQYAPRLADMSPTALSISEKKASDLGARLFDVETGSYGAGAEKKVLSEFAKTLRTEARAALEAFYAMDGGALGLIELTEISNTKATLWITEIYLSTLLELAKEGATSKQKTLVVVEEAHTVMPEAAFAGLGDFDSKGTIAKITQIALQGRKYGVGLLVLAQRTATVSKSVLTQCNTVISFSCIDDTSINFLKNVFGSAVADGLPSLPRLRAVADGSWIQAELPVAFDVPFDQEKADRKGWASQLGAGQVSHASEDLDQADATPPF